MRLLFFFTFFYLIHIFVFSQNQEVLIAHEYYKNHEYKKSESAYEELIKKNKDLYEEIHPYYLKTLLELKEFNKALNWSQKIEKAFPDKIIYQVDVCYCYDLLKNQKKLDNCLDNLEESLNHKQNQLEVVIDQILSYEKYTWAERILLNFKKKERNEIVIKKLASLYVLQNDIEKAVQSTLELLDTYGESEIEPIKNFFQDLIPNEENSNIIEKKLLIEIQKKPKNTAFNELIFWLYIQKKEFFKAFVQAKAIDKKQNLNGLVVQELGLVCFNNQYYKEAEKCFSYLVAEYPQSVNYAIARRYLIQSKEEQIKTSYPIDPIKVRSIIKDYEILLEEIGKNSNTLEAMQNMALLYAFYLDERTRAVQILQEAINLGRYNKAYVANCKLSLGDIYLLDEEPWEAALLYAQAEKLQNDSPVAYAAKLKRAKLSYYKGDFDLARSHLDVLKEATTRKIANDALQLSLLIRDNTGIDSTDQALKDYASIELQTFQNKNKEAIKALNTLIDQYKGHPIQDEAYWQLAQIYRQLGENEKAVEQLEKIIKDWDSDILADDAHFLLAELYDQKLGKKDKAMEMYKEHLLKYPGSIYVVEARKRFRVLRGDFN